MRATSRAVAALSATAALAACGGTPVTTTSTADPVSIRQSPTFRSV